MTNLEPTGATTRTIPPERSLRETVVRNAIVYTAGSALGNVGSILRIGMAGRLLPTDVAGAWLGLQLLITYGANLHLGVIFGMFRNAPMLRGAGREAEAVDVERTAFTFTLVTGVLGSLGIVAAQAFVPPSAGSPYVRATAGLVFLNQLRAYFVSRSKASSKFTALAVSSGIGSLVSVGTLGLIYVWGLDGLIAGMAAQALVETAYLVFQSGVPRLGMRWPALWDQLSVGFMTLLVSVATTLLTSVDRTVMLERLGATQTGSYYIGANIVVLIPVLFAAPMAVLTPRFFERFGKTGRGEDLLGLVAEPLRVVGVLVAGVLGVGSLALPAAVAHFWPRLAEGNTASYYAMIAAALIMMSGFITNVFYALNRQFVQLLILLVSAGVTYVLALVAAAVHPSLASVAAAFAVGMLLFYAVTMAAAYRLMQANILSALTTVGRSLLPTASCAVLVVVLRLVVGRFVPATTIAFAIIANIAFLAVTLPWLLTAAKRLRGRA